MGLDFPIGYTATDPGGDRLLDPAFFLHLPLNIAGVGVAQVGSHLAQNFARNSYLIGNVGPCRAAALIGAKNLRAITSLLTRPQRLAASFLGAVAFYGVHKLWSRIVDRQAIGGLAENGESLLYTWGMFGFNGAFMGGAALLGKNPAALLIAEYASFWIWEVFEGVARTLTRQLAARKIDTDALYAAAADTWSVKAIIERGAFLAGLKVGNRAFEPIQGRLADQLSLQQLVTTVREHGISLPTALSTSVAGIALALGDPNLFAAAAAGALAATITFRALAEQRQVLQLACSLQDITRSFGEVYAAGEKRVYRRHGLNFEYVVVTRDQFPYMVQLGTIGLCFGDMLFVMKDLLVHPEVPAADQARIMEIIAVHEYGESVLRSHHEASLLEFAVAQAEGFLARYLELMDRHYQLKFRDIALHRMGAELKEILQERGIQVDEVVGGEPPPVSESDPGVVRARSLKDAFRWPADLYDRYRVRLDRTAEMEREKIGEWAERITANEQTTAFLERAKTAALGTARGRAGQSPRAIQRTAEAAFYRTLFQLGCEFRDQVLNVDHLGGRAAEALDKTHAALAGATSDPFRQRSLRDHLEVLDAEQELMSEAEIEPPTTGRRRERDRFLQQQARTWGEAGRLIEQGTAASWKEAFARLIEQVKEARRAREAAERSRAARPRVEAALDRLKRDWERQVDFYRTMGDIPEADLIWIMEREILWGIAELARQTTGSFDCPAVLTTRDLQEILQPRADRLWDDLMAQLGPGAAQFHAGRRWKVNVAELRQEYGTSLERYLGPDNHPSQLAAKRLVDSYRNGPEKPSPDAVEAAVQKAVQDRFGQGNLEVFEYAQLGDRGEIPQEIAVSLIRRHSFEHRAIAEDAELLPLLMLERGLDPTEAGALLRLAAIDLNLKHESYSPLWVRAMRANLAEAATKESTEPSFARRLLETAEPERLASLPESWLAAAKLPELVDELARDGVDAVRKRLLGEEPARSLDLLARFQRLRQDLPWRIRQAEVYGKRQRQENERTPTSPKVQQRRLRAESAYDLFTFFRGESGKPIWPIESRILEQTLQLLDRIRRESLEPLYPKDVTAAWPSTVADLKFLRQQPPEISRHDLLHNYMALSRFIAGEPGGELARSIIRGPAWAYFLDCGDHALKTAGRRLQLLASWGPNRRKR